MQGKDGAGLGLRHAGSQSRTSQLSRLGAQALSDETIDGLAKDETATILAMGKEAAIATAMSRVLVQCIKVLGKVKDSREQASGMGEMPEKGFACVSSRVGPKGPHHTHKPLLSLVWHPQSPIFPLLNLPENCPYSEVCVGHLYVLSTQTPVPSFEARGGSGMKLG